MSNTMHTLDILQENMSLMYIYAYHVNTDNCQMVCITQIRIYMCWYYIVSYTKFCFNYMWNELHPLYYILYYLHALSTHPI